MDEQLQPILLIHDIRWNNYKTCKYNIYNGQWRAIKDTQGASYELSSRIRLCYVFAVVKYRMISAVTVRITSLALAQPRDWPVSLDYRMIL